MQRRLTIDKESKTLAVIKVSKKTADDLAAIATERGVSVQTVRQLAYEQLVSAWKAHGIVPGLEVKGE